MQESNSMIVYHLAENSKLIKEFSFREAKDIIKGKLDYTQFFEDREKSTTILNDLLRGRDKRIGFIEPPDFRQNITRVQ